MKRVVMVLSIAACITLLLLFVVTGCKREIKPGTTDYPADEFAIYFLADTAESNVYPLTDYDLSSLMLEPEP